MEQQWQSIVDEFRQYRHDQSLVVLLRGLSGSGKSTFARRLCRYATWLGLTAQICSADAWMQGPNGYEWRASDLHYAHSSCQEECARAIDSKVDVICIDNTNIMPREFIPYLEMSVDHVLRIVTFPCESLHDAIALARRSAHGVPDSVTKRRFEQFSDTRRNFIYPFPDGQDVDFIYATPQ